MTNKQKSPRATLEDKKFIFVLMGFIVALSVLYIGFEWTAKEVVVHEIVQTNLWEDDDLDIIQTAEPPPPPPPPPPQEIILEVLNVVDDETEVESIAELIREDFTEIVEIRAPVVAPIEEEDENVVFMVVETPPSFPGGMQALHRWLGQNINYPPIAQEHGIQGRVILQFTVNTDGSIVDIEVVRGVDRSLDREAVRVVQAMPKWTPGKQSGRQVRVRFTLPVNFVLQQ